MTERSRGEPSPSDPKRPGTGARRDRLAQALRENLGKRKAQQRDRRATGAEPSDTNPPAPGKSGIRAEPGGGT